MEYRKLSEKIEGKHTTGTRRSFKVNTDGFQEEPAGRNLAVKRNQELIGKL
jgi:hypothetical protein